MKTLDSAPASSAPAARPPGSASRWWLPCAGWAVAAMFAAATAYFNLRYVQQRAAADVEREMAQLAELELRSLKQRLEAEQILGERRVSNAEKAADIAQFRVARLSLLASPSPVVAVAVWNPIRQEGSLTVERLPVLNDTEEYQLWIVDPRYTTPVNCGLFGVRSDGTARLTFKPTQAINGATHFAISRERKGGVSKAEGTIIAAGAL